MSIFFHDQATGEKINSDKEVTCTQMLDLLHRLKAPNSTLITQLPSGLGLDFVVEGTAGFSVEFYADDISHAFVSRKTAEEIIKRAFEQKTEKIKEMFGDLITEWNR